MANLESVAAESVEVSARGFMFMSPAALLGFLVILLIIWGIKWLVAQSSNRGPQNPHQPGPQPNPYQPGPQPNPYQPNPYQQQPQLYGQHAQPTIPPGVSPIDVDTARNPATPPATLAHMVNHVPPLRPFVAANPALDPGLRQWLAGLGDPTINDALVRSQRR
ncbi:hypothetical protein [Gordonia sp. CPCC 205333]|uniref:variant leucine-rich repeat-containing protein n=1 Tax=Gordonia sp. CPCC 205333 TaxID=3140790 RepID=UPI003AF3496E